MSNFQGKKVLITGHTGFKGFWLSMILKSLGADVIGVSLKLDKNRKSHFGTLNGEDLIKTHYFDIRNLSLLKELIETIKPDYIFHLAAQALVADSFKNPINTFTTNAIGSINILESLRLLNCKCNLIMITSDKVYENVEWVYGYRENDNLGGYDPYSASKACAELSIRSYFKSYLKNSNIKLCIARAGNVIGGGDWSENRLVPDCIRSWTNNESVKLRSPDSTRPWQHVFDPINGYLTLALKVNEDASIEGEAFNFGPDHLSDITVFDAVKKLSEKWGDEAKYTFENKNFMKEAKLLRLNCDKSHSLLNWRPILDLDECIDMTIDWYKKSRLGKIETKKISESQINWFIDQFLNLRIK
tara:strand:+ start:15849 stop:16922 length:1074 start_codon:yes stop_codon:yes gene_type:complete